VRGVPRRNNGLLNDLIDLPWWVSLLVAGIVFVGIGWVLPAYAGSNMLLRPLAAGFRPFAWVFCLPFLLTAAFAALRASRRRDLLDSQRGLQTLRALSWQDFERLVGEAYRRRGYTVEEIGGSSPDGGVDLLLYAGGRKAVVQCKRWRTAQVGVSLVRELYGVMVAEKAERAIFVTSGKFTEEAKVFASGKPLELVDGYALAKLVEGVQTSRIQATEPRPHASKPLHTTAATLACPKCGSEMVKRVAKRGPNAGNAFWGCARYPECRGVRDGA
jgi:restriction system protein